MYREGVRSGLQTGRRSIIVHRVAAFSLPLPGDVRGDEETDHGRKEQEQQWVDPDRHQLDRFLGADEFTAEGEVAAVVVDEFAGIPDVALIVDLGVDEACPANRPHHCGENQGREGKARIAEAGGCGASLCFRLCPYQGDTKDEHETQRAEEEYHHTRSVGTDAAPGRTEVERLRLQGCVTASTQGELT